MFQGVVHGNVAFMIIATVLVFIMTPGLAFFYCGLVEKKNSLTILVEIFLSIGVVTIMWIFGGFSFVFGKDISGLGLLGDPREYFAFKHIVFAVNSQYGLTIPFLMFFMYQLMFAIITLPLMTGTIVNRIKIKGWIVFLIIWMITVYFPVAHWIWGDGFLHRMGFVDFAGGTVIHVSAAFSGLGALFVLGKRKIISKKAPFNLGWVALGGALLLFGWFGFNTGGTLSAAGVAAIVFTNTGVAASAGMVVWTYLGYHEKKHISFVDSLVGAIAGLATITPASGYVNPLSAFIIGGIAGFICFYAIKIPHKLEWDDVLDVWGVHGVGGFLGTILIGVFANHLINGIDSGIHQFSIQLLGASLVAVYSFILTVIIFKILDKSLDLRVTKEELEIGLDKSLLNEYFEEN